MKRAFIMVLDSFGIGATEDADRFGDVGADTMGHIAEACAKGEADNGRKGPLNLPNLTRLGLVKAHEGSTGKIAAGMDGNADICRRQGGRIVDAVADHHHRMSLGLGIADKGGFILRQHLCKAAVHPHLRRNGTGGAVAVASHHDSLGDAQLPELMQHLCRLRAQGVCDADDPRQYPGRCQIQVGILRVQQPSSSKMKWALPMTTRVPPTRLAMPCATMYSTSECISS